MHLLFVSIAFPPKNNPECLQAGKYFKYLSKIEDNEITVLTSASPTLFMPYDKSLEKITPATKRIEVKIPENKYINFVVRRVAPTLLQLPDSKFLFHWQWKNAMKELRVKPDLIYSRSFPLSSTIMALKLVKYFDVPWVMHLSDPWVDNPLEHRTRKASQINESWEKECFSIAKYVTLTSNRTVDFYRKKHPHFAEKFIFMPNVYDPDDMNGTRPEIDVSQKLHFVYTGGLTDTRTPEPLFEAIKLLQEQEPSILEHAIFSFAGQFDRKNIALFEKYKLPNVYNLGLLSYSDAVKLQKSGHVLLAFDSVADSEERALFFPSKLLDYIASKKKVLAITNDNSTTYEVIHEKYGDCLPHRSTQQIAQLIRQYVHRYKSGDADYFKNEIENEVFSASFNACRLNQLFERCVTQGNK